MEMAVSGAPGPGPPAARSLAEPVLSAPALPLGHQVFVKQPRPKAPVQWPWNLAKGLCLTDDWSHVCMIPGSLHPSWD